jgi:hypothetical protein
MPSLTKFLRHNSRHHLYFPGDWQWPQLNPYTSSSHTKSGKFTRSYHEPLWLFRLRQRWFGFAGFHRCAERGLAMPDDTNPFPDTWDIGPDDNRTCSYCGSIHPDDLMEICRKALTDEAYAVEPSTKRYKVYLRQPGVSNAGEGAIKFYMHHAPANPSNEDQDLFARAVRKSNERFAALMARKPAA